MTKIRESITGYVGPMYASKTLRMLHDVAAAEATGRLCLVFKPNNDDRFANNIVRSRAGGEHVAIPILFNRPEIIYDILKKHLRIDLAAFDEIQFFDPKVVQIVRDIAQSGIQVVFSGLNRDYRGNAFPAMEKLLPLATDLTIVEAKCMFALNGSRRLCGADAEMTQRLINGQPDSYNSPTVIIEKPGTSITYQARCLEHWAVTDLPTSRQINFKK